MVPRSRPALPSYRRLLEATWVMESPVGAVDQTLERVARVLREARVRFALAGGFAVFIHGYQRFTNDVDLLVRAADLVRALGALRRAGFRGGRTPLGARMKDDRTGVQVDLLGTAFEGDERALDLAQRVRRPLPVIPVRHLILMKLESGRSQDDTDVIELLKGGVSATQVTRYLRSTWPALLPRFRTLQRRARAERKVRPRRAPFTKSR